MSLKNQEEMETEIKKENKDTSQSSGSSNTVEDPLKDKIQVEDKQTNQTLKNYMPHNSTGLDKAKIMDSSDNVQTTHMDQLKNDTIISIGQTTTEDLKMDRIQIQDKQGGSTLKNDISHEGINFDEAKLIKTTKDAQILGQYLVKTKTNLSIVHNLIEDPQKDRIQVENIKSDSTFKSDIPYEDIGIGLAKINETNYNTQTSGNDLLKTDTSVSLDRNLDEQDSDVLEEDLVLKWDEDDIEDHNITEEISNETSGDNDGVDTSQNKNGNKVEGLKVNIDIESSTAIKLINNTSNTEYHIENNGKEPPVASDDLNNEGTKPEKLQNVTDITKDNITEKFCEELSCVIDKPATVTKVDIYSSTENEVATQDLNMQTADSTIKNKDFEIDTNVIPIKIEVDGTTKENCKVSTASKLDCDATNVSKITTSSILDHDTLEDSSATMAVDTEHHSCKLETMTETPCEETKMDITDFIKNNRELSDVNISVDLGLETVESKLSESIPISSACDKAAEDKLENKDDVASKHTEVLSNISDTIDGNVKMEVTENIIKEELMDLAEPDCSLDDNINKVNTENDKTEHPSVKSELSEIQDLPVDIIKLEETVKNEPESQPSTSEQFDDDILEATDSLGLLAESSRVMDDEEEMEEDEEGDDGDEEDYDQDDESSNQMTAEHSEDSNAPQSESDMPKEHTDTDTDNAQKTGEKENAGPSPKDQIMLDKEMTTHPEEGISDNDILLQGDHCADECGPSSSEEQDSGLQIGIENIVSKTTSDTRDTEVEDVDLDTQDLGEQTELGINDESEKITATTVDAPPDTIDKESGEPILISQIPEVESGVSQSMDLESDVVKDLPNEKDTDIQKNSLLKTLLEDSADETMSPVRKKSKRSPKKTAVEEVISCSISLESSSEDEMPDASKSTEPEEMTCVNIPNDIEIMSSGAKTCEIVTKEGEVVISGVPKPKLPQKTARLNTSEVTIKTTTTPSESTLVIPETKVEDPLLPKDDKPKSPAKYGLEIFNLDSDDDEQTQEAEETAKNEETLKKEANKCINFKCKSDAEEEYLVADLTTMSYYDYTQKKKAMVCQACADVVTNRMKGLLEGLENMTPLLDLDFKTHNDDFVEISDSESEEELDVPTDPEDRVGVAGAKLLEEQLTDMMNMTWTKYNMDDRLNDAVNSMNAELERLEQESIEMNTLLSDCQTATDKLRNDFYDTFERKFMDLPALLIFDTPNMQYETPEEPMLVPPTSNSQSATAPTTETETRKSKRKLSSAIEQPAKKPAIPLGYTPLDNSTTQPKQEKESKIFDSQLDNMSPNKTDDDNADVSVVKLSAEAAPDSLPPPGELVRTPVRVGMTVFAMRNAFGSWLKAKVVECQPKGSNTQFTMCRVKFEHKVKNPCKLLPARCLAYFEPTEVRMVIGTRVIALFKDDNNTSKGGSYYSGVVAEMPNPVNNYRYLVFFDDGYAQYVQHGHTRLVCECSALVWEEVHPFSREFVRQYLRAYPERPMVRLHAGQSLKTEWNGKWWASKVIKVDASLVNVHFEEDNRTEWIYRGSTRLAPLYLELQAAERHRARPLPRSTSNKAPVKANMPYVEYTRSDEQGNDKPVEPTPPPPQTATEDVRRQRAVAKKSTAIPSQPVVPQQANLDTVTSRVVYYTPKNAVKPYKMTPHVCGPKCKRTDVLALKDLRTYNPLAKPLLSGWERQIVRYKGYKQVMYRTPCGRRVRNVRELHFYLRTIQSDMSVDLFDFGPNTHCLAEFVLNKCIVSKKDLSNGKENVPVPCVNYYDDSLPEFCLYNTERTPTEGVPLNTDPEFLCGCDCTDDCEDKSKCACWQLTLEGAHTIGYDGEEVGYLYRRLPEPLPSGIYECNSRCKCKSTCLNRVAQHPLQLKLQVFKTLNRGWGIRALNDVPKGSFLCVYAGNLLTDATANLDGLNEGDEYLAELDYIEVVEQLKEGYEEDIPEADKELDRQGLLKSAKNSDESSDDEDSNRDEQKDDDFRPNIYEQGFENQEYSKRLRKRDRKKDKAMKNEEKKDGDEEECITISDDEEVREPSRFMAQAGMGANEFVSKYRSVRAHFGRDEACYIMDAKVQGNIGRYLNHSCTPNVFVQNVFVDTHDPRFPWVAFFALSHIRAGTELTWNYNYDVGSVPGKVLYCYCGAPNCRGRLL